MAQLNWTAKPWADSELLECAMVVPESDDTASSTFRAPSGAWFDYLPGQFVTLETTCTRPAALSPAEAQAMLA